jgi:D-alanine-D-alanine ligase
VAAPDSADFLHTMANRDVVFPVFHGRGGEDGTIQALARRLGVVCAGASMEASALGMDKVLTKRVAAHHGLAVAPWREVTSSQWKTGRTWLLDSLPRELGWPLFVKPARLGSSIGVGRATDPASLQSALESALQFDNLVLVESEIRGKEYSVGVVGDGHACETSVVAEFCMDSSSFDYDSKYGPQAEDDIIPARLSSQDTQTLLEFARKVAGALDIRGISRIDSFWGRRSDGTDGPILNEVNTMPGLSAAAPFILSWEKAGVTKRELMDKIVAHALTTGQTRGG